MRRTNRAMSSRLRPFSGERFRMAGAGRREDLDDALSLLTILYHHVPSVTRCRSTWGNWMRCCNRMLEFYTRRDRYSNKTFLALPRQNPPDAFMHANIGPSDSPITRAIYVQTQS